MTQILNLCCFFRVKVTFKVEAFTLQRCKKPAQPRQLPWTHLKVSHVLCREVMWHLSLCLPSGTFLHRSCRGHGWSFRASHSQPLQCPLTLLDRLLCIFECLLLSVTHIRSQNTQWDTDIKISTRLVVRSRTHRDTSHRVKHFVVWFNLTFDTL